MKKLPVTLNVMSSTYQYIAYEFAVLQSHPIMEEYILSYYNLKCDPKFLFSHKSADLELAIRVDNFQGNGCFNTFTVSHDNYYVIKDIIDFVINAIDHDRYIYMFNFVDEFFIPQKLAYQKFHNVHDLFIYGYNFEDKIFYSLAYLEDGKFKELEISFDDFNKCVVTDYSHQLIDSIFAHTHVSIKFTPSRFQEITRQYLSSINPDLLYKGVMHPYYMSEPTIYGIRVYNYIDLYLANIISDNLNGLDLRFFRQLWEQKLILKSAVNKLTQYIDLPLEYINVFDDLYSKANIVRSLSIKYDSTKNVGLITKMREHIKSIAENEINTLNKIMECIL